MSEREPELPVGEPHEPVPHEEPEPDDDEDPAPEAALTGRARRSGRRSC